MRHGSGGGGGGGGDGDGGVSVVDSFDGPHEAWRFIVY